MAEYLVNLWPFADMVKFGKNGSDVVSQLQSSLGHIQAGSIYWSVALILFSIHDWFIGSTEMNSGTIASERAYTLKFNYNDIDSVEEGVQSSSRRYRRGFNEPVKNDSPI